MTTWCSGSNSHRAHHARLPGIPWQARHPNPRVGPQQSSCGHGFICVHNTHSKVTWWWYIYIYIYIFVQCRYLFTCVYIYIYIYLFVYSCVFYPLGIEQFPIENSHRNSELSHEKGWFSIAMLVHHKVHHFAGCQAVRVKQCHKPPMTGNGNHTLYLFMAIWGWFSIVCPHYTIIW